MERYNLTEFLNNDELPGREWLEKYGQDTSKYAMQHLSDYLRLVWIFFYGGSCLCLIVIVFHCADIDCDFIIAHPFPNLTNMLSHSEGNGCKQKTYRLPKCIPLNFRDCYQDEITCTFFFFFFGLYSIKLAENSTGWFIPHNGVLLNFKPRYPKGTGILSQSAKKKLILANKCISFLFGSVRVVMDLGYSQTLFCTFLILLAILHQAFIPCLHLICLSLANLCISCYCSSFELL